MIMSTIESKEYYDISEQVSRVCCNVPEVDIDKEWEQMKIIISKTGCTRMRAGKYRWLSTAAGLTLALVVSGGIYLMVNNRNYRKTEISETETMATDKAATKVCVYPKATTFNNESVESVVRKVAETFGIPVNFANSETAALRIHLEVDSGLTIEGFVDLINKFESINASLVERNNTTYLEIR